MSDTGTLTRIVWLVGWEGGRDSRFWGQLVPSLQTLVPLSMQGMSGEIHTVTPVVFHGSYRKSLPWGGGGTILLDENEVFQSNRNDFPTVTFTLDGIWWHVILQILEVNKNGLGGYLKFFLYIYVFVITGDIDHALQFITLPSNLQ
jgi:hypothetical protein